MARQMIFRGESDMCQQILIQVMFKILVDIFSRSNDRINLPLIGMIDTFYSIYFLFVLGHVMIWIRLGSMIPICQVYGDAA